MRISTTFRWLLVSLTLLIPVHVAQAWYGSYRANETSTDGVTVQGDSITVTWSIIPDGTFTHYSAYYDHYSYSSFISQMDKIFDVPEADRDLDDLTQRSWFAIIEEALEDFTVKTGITYIYVHENNDESDADTGTPLTPHSLGVPGKRGDMRIGGADLANLDGLTIAGPSTISDAHGNAVLSSATDWTAGSLRVILAHENTHCVGLHHSYTPDGETLSGNSINGPQLDDLMLLHYLYGDIYEKSGGNDTIASATDLGTLSSSLIGVGLDLTESDTYPLIESSQTDFVSIDSNTDTDVFKFSLAQDQDVILKLSPRGPTYGWDVLKSDDPRNTAYTKEHSDLSFRVLDASGNELYSAASAGMGMDESIEPFLTAGDYYIEITGLSTNEFAYKSIPTQFYALEVSPVEVATAPVAYGQSITVSTNEIKAINLSSSSLFASYTVVSSPTNGVFSGTAPELLYTPNTAYVGADSFTFYASDSGLNSDIVTVTIDVISSGFYTWVNESENSPDTSFNSDPDNDGLETGLEYVLDTDPAAANDGVFPEITEVDGELVFSFTRLASSTEDTVQVFQYSSTLQEDDWTDISITSPVAAEVVIGNEVNGLETVTATMSKDLAIDGVLFGRLKVSLVE